MNLNHPVVQRNATPPTPLPAAFDSINAALQSLDNGKADAAHTHALADVVGLVAALAGKANATHTHAQSDIVGLVAALAGKSNVGHGHAAGEITGLAPVATSGAYSALTGRPPLFRTASRRASTNTALANGAWRAITFDTALGTDEIGFTMGDANRTLIVPAGISRLRLAGAVKVTASNLTYSLCFSRNAAAVDTFASFPGNEIRDVGVGSFWLPTIESAWIDVAPGDAFRLLVRQNTTGTVSAEGSTETWISVEAY